MTLFSKPYTLSSILYKRMPNTTSAKKALRQSIRRRARNIDKKEALKKVVKSYKKLITAKDLEAAKEQLSLVYKKLDKAAKTRLIKANHASRLKSRLTKLLGK